MTPPDDPRRVRISVQGRNEDLSEVFLLDDDAPPALDGGFGGWQDEQRDGRRALLAYTGPGTWSLTVPTYMDVHLPGGTAALMRRRWRILRALWSSPHPGVHPPLATIEGKALTLPAVTGDEHRNWALTGLTARLAEHAPFDSGGVRAGEVVRWAGTLSFARVTTEPVLRIAHGPNAGTRVRVVKVGETLAYIARAECVDIAKVKWAKTGKLVRDPKKVKPGDTLRLPPRKKAC